MRRRTAAMGASSYDRDTTVTDKANGQTMTMHYAVRDGSVWMCVRCKRVLGPFGQGIPETKADCTPRRWGDGAA
jgi:hypothetical protein